ncbi:MAG TPA: DUF2721 domain-containing protein [Trebonia sp.]|nr:DUF2721 domain-containing protein [Trebonia sp.]
MPPADRERLAQIDTQLPMLLLRHRLLHNAVLLIYIAVAVLVLSVIAIAVAVTRHSTAAGTAALTLVLAGTVVLLGGLLFGPAVDHHLDERDRLRGPAHPFARILTKPPTGHLASRTGPGPGTCSGQFWAYENWVAAGHRATVHRGERGFCNNGAGVHGGGQTRNGRWPGHSLA